eukprot:3701931-Prymnesium_polylepis.1
MCAPGGPGAWRTLRVSSGSEVMVASRSAEDDGRRVCRGPAFVACVVVAMPWLEVGCVGAGQSARRQRGREPALGCMAHVVLPACGI